MSSEREKNFALERPRYKSPYFSYEILGIGELKGLISQAAYGHSYLRTVLSKDTDGIIGPIELYGSSTVLSFGADLKVPHDWTKEFITMPGINFPGIEALFKGSSKRGYRLQQDIKKFIDKEFVLDESCKSIDRVRDGVNISEVASISDVHSSISYRINGGLALSDGLFQRQLENILDLTIMYATVLHDHYRIEDSHSKIVISPENFQVISQTMDPAKKRELLLNPAARNQFFTETIFHGEAPQAAIEHVIEEGHEKNNPPKAKEKNVVDFKKPEQQVEQKLPSRRGVSSRISKSKIPRKKAWSLEDLKKIRNKERRLKVGWEKAKEMIREENNQFHRTGHFYHVAGLDELLSYLMIQQGIYAFDAPKATTELITSADIFTQKQHPRTEIATDSQKQPESIQASTVKSTAKDETKKGTTNKVVIHDLGKSNNQPGLYVPGASYLEPGHGGESVLDLMNGNTLAAKVKPSIMEG